VADRDEITALVYRYAELLDGGDIDGVFAMFADATWRSAATGAVLRSPEEIRAVYDRIMLYDGTPKTQHVMSNLTIDLVEGADEATGRCYYTVLQGLLRARPIRPSWPGAIWTGTGAARTAGTADRLFIVDLPGRSRHVT
jgi:3-phenylpropionate/cinnamic acid dioxygenase small subunit